MNAISEIREDETGKSFSATTFLEYLRPSNSKWWEVDPIAKHETCPWVFRGHASSDWKLIPSAFREKNLMNYLHLSITLNLCQ